jgi:hypothetical protein
MLRVTVSKPAEAPWVTVTPGEEVAVLAPTLYWLGHACRVGLTWMLKAVEALMEL